LVKPTLLQQEEAEAFDHSGPTTQWKLLYQAGTAENSAFCRQLSKRRLSVPIWWHFEKPVLISLQAC